LAVRSMDSIDHEILCPTYRNTWSEVGLLGAELGLAWLLGCGRTRCPSLDHGQCGLVAGRGARRAPFGGARTAGARPAKRVQAKREYVRHRS
jgi:hypothetical protein